MKLLSMNSVTPTEPHVNSRDGRFNHGQKRDLYLLELNVLETAFPDEMVGDPTVKVTPALIGGLSGLVYTIAQ